MNIVITALIASFITSLPSALVFIFAKPGMEIKHFMISLAAGTMLGAGFVHMIPESYSETSMIVVVLTIFLFFTVEKFVRLHTCTKHRKHIGWMAMIGDSLHNMTDGMALYASFLVSMPAGIAVTLSILLHEIPQELGDMAVLLHSGFSKKSAILLNFSSALISLLGVLIGYVMNGANLDWLLLPFAAGSFIYISMSDLIPELHEEGSKKWAIHIAGVALGLAVMVWLKTLR